MFSFEHPVKPLNNNEAISIINDVIENNPDSIHILVGINKGSKIFFTQDCEETIVDVSIKNEDMIYTFKIPVLISLMSESNVKNLTHQHFKLSVRDVTEHNVHPTIQMCSVDKYGWAYYESDVTLDSYKLESEITQIFNIINERSINNGEDLTVFYEIIFDAIPF